MPHVMELPHCKLCGKDYVNDDVITGVRFKPADPAAAPETGEYFEGHYDCVVVAMGPEKTLLAIQGGLLPPEHVAKAHVVLTK